MARTAQNGVIVATGGARELGANFRACTKIKKMNVADLANARIWCDAEPKVFRAACGAVRPFPANARVVWFCAGLAHTWHRSCFIGADRFVRA
jgi:hypothetical protein